MKHVPEVKIFDIILIFIYIIWCVFLTIGYKTDYLDFQFVKKAIGLTGFAPAFLIYGIYSKQLRNNKIFLAWFVIGSIQFIIYLLYSDLPEFSNARGSVLSPIKGLLFTVIVYRGIRHIYYKIFRRELIITDRRGFVGSRSLEEQRTIGKSDFVFSIIGGLIIIFATIFP
jgi:FlaA1/EpsC-like NDP-sugar epimerase